MQNNLKLMIFLLSALLLITGCSSANDEENCTNGLYYINGECKCLNGKNIYGGTCFDGSEEDGDEENETDAEGTE